MSLFKAQKGGDTNFPWLSEDERYQFPHPDYANSEGILCCGGNLSPGMLLSAYSQGIFPWYNSDELIFWWSPDPRFVLMPGELHVSASMKKIIKKRLFMLSLDSAFDQVIEYCSKVYRPGQHGTWITRDMLLAYKELHRLGYAHSVEAWQDGQLAGGFYGIAIGSAFFGESMFSLKPDASKAAFIPFAWFLEEKGFTLIDSQVHTRHMETMGAKNISRRSYLELLDKAVKKQGFTGSWAKLFPDFPASKEMASLGHGKAGL